VALPPRILACSTTYIHSRMAYWKLTSIPPACYFPSIEQVLVSNLRWKVSICRLEVRTFLGVSISGCLSQCTALQNSNRSLCLPFFLKGRKLTCEEPCCL
jgi:hypothetical protein